MNITTPNTIVRQPYAVTMAKHRLNTHEMRIMFRIIEALQSDMIYGKGRACINNTLFGSKIVRLRTKNLLPTGSKNYGCVRRALKSLTQKSITIEGKDENGEYEVNTNLVMLSTYHYNNEFVELELSKYLLSSYLALAKNYSKYLLEIAFNSSSPNIMKLYQFISHWRDKNKIQVTLEELRNFLQLENKYEKSRDVREYILESASKELKKRADIWFEIVEPIKQGRRITGWIFKIYRKSQTAEDKRLAVVHEENLKNYLITLFKLKSHHIDQLRPMLAKSELHGHIYDKLKDIAQSAQKTQIKNLQAYVITALKNEFSEVMG